MARTYSDEELKRYLITGWPLKKRNGLVVLMMAGI
jgi:hypothetical protein